MADSVRDAWHIPRVIIFLAVVEHGSISAAARELSLSKSVVSTHLKQLEQVCGVRLFERSTRRVSLTQAGATCLPYAQRLTQAWSQGLEALESQIAEPTGTLVVTAPSLLDRPLLEAVGEYTRRYPRVEIQVRISDEILDLITENIDVALRVGPLADSDMIARKLGDIHEVIMASPSFLEGRTLPDHPAQIASWPWVTHSALPLRRTLQGPNGQSITLEPSVQVTTDQAQGMQNLVMLGVGLAILPRISAQAELNNGSLVRILPNWRARTLGAYVVYPSKEHQTPRVSHFLEILRDCTATLQNSQS